MTLQQQHPRLYRRCLKLCEGDECAAAILCNLVVTTAPAKGEGGIVTEVETIWLSPQIKKMKLYKLMGAVH